MKRTTISLFLVMVLTAVTLVGCVDDIIGGGGGNGEGDDQLTEAFNTLGASNALFSVAPKQQVRFSKGNLQHHPDYGAWRFAENQYEVLLDSNTHIDEHYRGWIDLFGWGTSGWDGGNSAYQPWSVDLQDNNYWVGNDYTNGLFGPGEQGDWGVHNSIYGAGNQPGLWRTLKRDEWRYLLDTNDVRKGRWGFGKLSDKYHGLIILPDEWKLPAGLTFEASDGTPDNSTLNEYSLDNWKKMEAAGAIFLPVAGVRNGKNLNNDPSMQHGNYWTASYRDQTDAYNLEFNFQGAGTTDNDELLTRLLLSNSRHFGLAVRLVQDKK